MMTTRIGSSEAPLWRRIMHVLEAETASGALAQGSKLPSENQLREHFGASRTSVRAALAELESRGFIRRHQGARATVATANPPSAWALPSAPSLLGQFSTDGRSLLTSEILRAGVEPLPSWAAAIVGDTSAADASTGFTLERVRALNGHPAVVVTNHLPARFAQLLPELRDPHASLYSTLARVAGVIVTQTQRTIEAVTATPTIAQHLQLEAGQPVLVVDAVAHDDRGRPIDVSRGYIRSDRLRVSVTSRFSSTTTVPHGKAPDMETHD